MLITRRFDASRVGLEGLAIFQSLAGIETIRRIVSAARGDVEMPAKAKAPKTYSDFRDRFPQLDAAWDSIREAERAGPLDDKTTRLIKLGIAIGAQREGAVHSALRKALAAGARSGEIWQVVALAASTIGMPSTVAVYSWIRDELDER
jgi:alkylhydroperoxidase/carboxymuconolactone decarboxylase family protein YurZ